MARSFLLCSLLLCIAAVSRAGDVHKCVTPSGIAYQSAPCAGAELPVSAAIASATQTPPATQANAMAIAPARTAASCDATAQQASPRLPWRHTAICIGMTDDEVLNLPGWGRPAAINRTRTPREWREEWFYDASRAVRPRQLFFVNGKLDAIETDLVEPIGPLAKVDLTQRR